MESERIKTLSHQKTSQGRGCFQALSFVRTDDGNTAKLPYIKTLSHGNNTAVNQDSQKKTHDVFKLLRQYLVAFVTENSQDFPGTMTRLEKLASLESKNPTNR